MRRIAFQTGEEWAVNGLRHVLTRLLGSIQMLGVALDKRNKKMFDDWYAFVEEDLEGIEWYLVYLRDWQQRFRTTDEIMALTRGED